MKINLAYIIIGVFLGCIGLFTYIKIQGYHLQNENLNTDEVFNDYVTIKKQQIKSLQTQTQPLSFYIENLQDAIKFIDSVKLPPPILPDNPKKKDSILILEKASNNFQDIAYIFRGIIFSDSSSNSYIQNSARKITKTFIDEFRTYNLYYLNLSNDYYENDDNPRQNIKNRFDEFFNETSLKSHKQNIKTKIQQEIGRLSISNSDNQKNIDSLNNEIKNIKDAQKKATENSRDKLLITWVIPIFAIMLIVITLIPVFLRSQKDIVDKILDNKILLQVFTVFILVITILLLGIGDKLSGETLGTLIGGISVFVLQKSLEGGDHNPDNTPNNN